MAPADDPAPGFDEEELGSTVVGYLPLNEDEDRRGEATGGDGWRP